MKARLSPQRIGRWSAAHPGRALTVWFVFVVACVALGARTGTQTLSDGAVGESARGNAVMDQQGLWGPPREYAYLHSNGDLHRVELLAIPVTLVVLLLAFGSDDVLLLCQNDASEETRADAGRRWSWGRSLGGDSGEHVEPGGTAGGSDGGWVNAVRGAVRGAGDGRVGPVTERHRPPTATRIGSRTPRSPACSAFKQRG